jgi:tetratricopeptide (TPR) repeat protein
LNSNDPDTLTNAGQISALHGDDATALQRLNAALTVDPLNATAYQALGVVLYLKGDYSGTESALRKSISIDSQIDGSHYWIGLMELDRSGPNEALREFGAEVDIAARDSGIALAKHALGQKAESDTALAHLMSEAGNTWPTLIVRACAYRGERDRAFDWLEKAYAVRDVDLLNAAREPLLVPLHDDPRWSALMKSMNLAESIGHAPQSPAQ